MEKLKKIRIRMYRQGLGDCFLLTLHYGEMKKFHILIDCGVILGTEQPEGIMTKVAENIKTETAGTINAVVITHEHWDHLSGFTQARPVFDTIKFDEVWMAWTEDPKHGLAKKLRKTREDRKAAIAKAVTGLWSELDGDTALGEKQKAAKRSYLNAVEEVMSFNGGLGANGSATTAEALAYVKEKAGNNLFFCTPGAEPFDLKEIDGIRFYVLGPPEDEKLLKKDLSTKEVYHKLFMDDWGANFMSALNAAPDSPAAVRSLPFSPLTGMKLQDAQQNNFIGRYFAQQQSWRRIDADWMDFAGQLALALDSDTNNTSLVLALELTDSGKFLLFPGDAQVGNWLSWHNYTWPVRNTNGGAEALDIAKIFSRTIFYKVGHHGSHNATLSTNGLELMTNSELTAMIPVNKAMAKKKKWHMPFQPLFEALQEKCSGKVLMADDDFSADGAKPNNISASRWNRFRQSVHADPLFVDFEIDCSA